MPFETPSLSAPGCSAPCLSARSAVLTRSLSGPASPSLDAVSRRGGFTLIEILIVISIIALLSGFILVAVQRARRAAGESTTKVEVSSLSTALDSYVQDEADYPGSQEKIDPNADADEANHFPFLFEAIFGQKRPAGKGGRNAPYTNLDEKRVAIWDPDSESYESATLDQIRNPKVKKYLLDSFGKPFVYRANKGRRLEEFMHRDQSADIYSLGFNGIDDTWEMNEDGDDIGNW